MPHHAPAKHAHSPTLLHRVGSATTPAALALSFAAAFVGLGVTGGSAVAAPTRGEVAELAAARVADDAASRDRAPEFVRPSTGELTSVFGPRWGRQHQGVDLAGGTGTPVVAVAAGTVTSAAHEGAYGNIVRIAHEDGTETVYAHLSRIDVQPGTPVVPEQIIGLEGNTGRSTGPHLHFEVRVNGAPVDPRVWLAERGVGL